MIGFARQLALIATVAPEETVAKPWYAPVQKTLSGLANGFLERLPLIVIGAIILALGVMTARLAARGTERALRLRDADRVAERLTFELVRLLVLLAALLLALSVAGIPIGSVLAGLGIAGLAVAIAVQSILENFISGVVLLIRKPFRPGEQIQSNDFEGTVEDLDLRVTRLLTYDGEVVLIPNAEVFKKPLVNLTRRGRRRTSVCVGIDYRDDHNAAREVLRRSLVRTPGVLVDPEPEVLLTELGESSVNFELRYWTLPDIRSVRHVQDRVLAGVKSAVEEAGMTIPWPIRTLMWDQPAVSAGHTPGG